MDHRHVLRFISTSLALFAVVALAGCAAPSVDRPEPGVSDSSTEAKASAGEQGKQGIFRVHRLNSKGQMVRNMWTRKSERPGCHDLRGTKRAYKVAQIGFAWCSVYSAGDCKPGTELGAMWRGKKYRRGDIDIEQPQTRILQGSNWFLSEEEDKQNVRVGSWRCEY